MTGHRSSAGEQRRPATAYRAEGFEALGQLEQVAELTGVGPQALRLYERHGLLHPARTDGGTRRYSDADLHRLQRITDLIGTGVNLVGIAQILHLQTTNTQLETDTAQLRATKEADHDRAHPVR